MALLVGYDHTRVQIAQGKIDIVFPLDDIFGNNLDDNLDDDIVYIRQGYCEYLSPDGDRIFVLASDSHGRSELMLCYLYPHLHS